MNTPVENLKASNDRVLEGVKKAQGQVVDFNERAAEFVSTKLPSRAGRVDLSFANRAAEGYFDFVGDMISAQRDFTSRIIDIWTPAADAETTEESTTKKKAKASA